MIGLLIYFGCLFLGVWVLFETWKGQLRRVLILVGLGSLGMTNLGAGLNLMPVGEYPGPGWLILWVPSVLGFLIGRRLEGWKVYPRRLDWVEGPVEAVAAVMGLLAVFWRKRVNDRHAVQAFQEDAQQEALEQVLDLGNRSVDEVMISRSEMDPL